MNGYTALTPLQTLIGPGVIYRAGLAWSTTRGGVRVEFLNEIREVEFDGRRAPVAGLDRVVSYGVRVTATALELNLAQASRYNLGITGVLASDTTTFTPRDGGSSFFPAGAYVDDILVVVRRVDGTLVGVRIPRALVTYTLGGEDKSEAGLDTQFEARTIVAGSVTTQSAPYTIEFDTSGAVEPPPPPPEDDLPPNAQASLTWLFDPAVGGGGQTHPSVVGPSAMLGTTGSVDTNDPTLASSPARYTYDADDLLDFGDGLDPMFTGPNSVLVAVELSAGDVAGGATFRNIISKDTTVAGGREFSFALIDGSLELSMFFGGDVTNRDQYNQSTVMTAGRHTVGFSYDPSLARASRGKLYVDGVAVAQAFTGFGTDGTVSNTSAPVRTGLRGSIRGPAATGKLEANNAIMTAADFLANHNWMVAGGWS